MKNQKIMSIAFAIALLLTMVPNSLALTSDSIIITGIVTGGVSIEAGIDVTIMVDPANGVPWDDTVTRTNAPTTTVGNDLTVSSNDGDGFTVTVELMSLDTTPSLNTLGITTTAVDLATEGGLIKFKAVGTGSLSTGTGEAAYVVYTGATTHVFNIDDVQVTGGIIEIDHMLSATTAVLPGTYTGTATYTIAGNV